MQNPSTQPTSGAFTHHAVSPGEALQCPSTDPASTGTPLPESATLSRHCWEVTGCWLPTYWHCQGSSGALGKLTQCILLEMCLMQCWNGCLWKILPSSILILPGVHLYLPWTPEALPNTRESLAAQAEVAEECSQVSKWPSPVPALPGDTVWWSVQHGSVRDMEVDEWVQEQWQQEWQSAC